MNNNITEDYCSFEVSKLLKEKGFDVQYRCFYGISDDSLRFDNILCGQTDLTIIAPTHALAIKWIRENFAIELWVQPYNDEELSQILYEWRGFDVKDDWNDIEGYEYFHSPEEATEAALLYTLKNLI